MTDPTPDPLDELASAHLDGVADPAARSTDPELQARIDAFEAVRAAIRSPVPAPSAEAREAAILAALGAAEATAAGDDGPGAPTVVAFRRRRLAHPGWARVAGIAAAIALVAALVPVLLGGGGDEDPGDQTAASDAVTTVAPGDWRTQAEHETSIAVDDGAGAGGAADSTGDAPLAAMAAAPLPHLGAHPDLVALAGAVEQAFAAPVEDAPAATPPGEAAQACVIASHEAAAVAGRVVVLVATADLAARPVVVAVHEDPAGERTLIVVDPAAACEVVATQPL